MDPKAVNGIIYQIWADKYARYSFITISAIILVFSFLRLASGIIILTSYISGFIVFSYFMKYKSDLEHRLICMITGNRDKCKPRRGCMNVFKVSRGTDLPPQPSCSVCGERTCVRGGNINSVSHCKPWDGLMVPQQVDSALEELLNQILDEFVASWYKDISMDADFVMELRRCIRYSASVILCRGLQLDLGELITQKLVPAAVRHVDAQVRSAGASNLNIHPTTCSREVELDYLRSVTMKILPSILQHSHLHCKIYSMIVREIIAGWVLLPLSDALSDPAVLHNLMMLMLGRQPFTQYPAEMPSDHTEFLANFAQVKEKREEASALHPDMCVILKQQSLLYSFMQFLKNQGAVHVLQFCLDVEEFNRKMLIPELNTEELDRLYKDAWDLYSVYFSHNSPDVIPFPPEYVTNMRKVLSKDVTKLRTSPPLFQAYEFAYNLLDTTYCPLFHNSDDFYTWLCGPRVTSIQNKSGSSSPSVPGSPAKVRTNGRGQDGSSAVSRIGSRLNKIKGALTAQPVMEGQAFHLETDLDLETDSDFAEALHLCERERNLSAWRVSIPSCGSRFDAATGKQMTVYVINVQRIDVTEGDCSQWTVERKLVDFYTLEAKLEEFHGEFADAQLPSRRLLPNTFGSRATESIHVYEEYLHKLLSKPSLRGSDLLFSFLSCRGEFMAEVSALGRLLRRSVPIPLSLRKERGQNLDPFISTFFTSTESRSKNSKLEWKDLSEELSPRKKRNITGSVFGDNLGVGNQVLHMRSPHMTTTNFPLDTPSQCFLFALMKWVRLPTPLLTLLLALENVFGKGADCLMLSYINHKLTALLVPPRLAHLIRLLKSIIFEKRPSVTTSRHQTAMSTLALIREASWLPRHVFLALYTLLQNPMQNKQLFYVLLDTCLLELFPELKSEDEQATSETKSEDNVTKCDESKQAD